MRHTRPVGSFTIFAALAGVAAFLALFMTGPAHGQMMNGGGMNGMREMMQRMMGDVLPPGIDPKLLPDPGSRGARLLERYCTQCHNLPGPGMHTAAEWPQVVRRMNGRMQMMSGGMMGGGMMNVSAPSAAELNTLIEYRGRANIREIFYHSLELRNMSQTQLLPAVFRISRVRR